MRAIRSNLVAALFVLVAAAPASVATADAERDQRYEAILAGLRAECVKDSERQLEKCLAAADQERETSRCNREQRAAAAACRDPSTPAGAALVERAEELDDEAAIRQRGDDVEIAPPPPPAATPEPAPAPDETEEVAPAEEP